MTTPLAGITVLDFGQIYQGPYATMLMAKAGADVIKIEPPGGEPLRRRVIATGGETTLPIAMLNANKRGVTLNLKSEAGKDLLKQMVAKADVLLENFAPGTLDGLGVGYDVLRPINPSLIYATGTGFGISGPDRDNLAMDFTIQAASGIMSITGDPDGPPMKAGPALVDFLGGIHLYAAVLSALLQRQATGLGQLVEVAMQEAVYPTLATSYDYHLRTGKVPPRTGNRPAGLGSAPYNAFRTRDGWVAIYTVTDAHWQALLRVMGRADLADDPRFASHAARARNMDATEALVTAWTVGLDNADVVAAAKRNRIPAAAVRNPVEVMNDPHMHERGMLRRIEHPALGSIIVPDSPLRLHGSERVEPLPSPSLGQHNMAVYGEWLGLGTDGVARLQQAGAI
ncbi:CaiB/BaiF CoA transferase family protein [Rhodopila sp.]|uniref:CaiB/BaiF CoA transferase family protein n=1 Tax=Rhodopila sp. TaxID=2480087 RepID=UPI003D09909A